MEDVVSVASNQIPQDKVEEAGPETRAAQPMVDCFLIRL